ncbi:MAG TPA: SOS response-associated peptidase [Mesorhizobium sp.]|jgi:putative SOS response-associated peptidase YedK|nr:SOS response-associated peptidase [Mesorhizobium sp.]
MCNLYNLTKGPQALLRIAQAFQNRTGNLPPSDYFPDSSAPVIRADGEGKREIAKLRWGMPSPFFALKGRDTDPGVTNIRNVASPHWRRWVGVEHRCLVPATRFCEWEDTKPKKTKVWFALTERQAEDDPDGEPLFFFAGLWTPWRGVRKKAEGEQDLEVFGFLTTEANGVVKPIHPKAMPVLLTTREEIEAWMGAPTPEALKLQRPLPDRLLRIVGRGDQP